MTLLLLALLAARFEPHEAGRLAGERIAGAAVSENLLLTWGDRLLEWTLPAGRPEVLRGAGPELGPGGAVTDVDGDGYADLVLNEQEPPALVWFRAGAWTRGVIDTGVRAPDLIPAVLHGRRGVVLVHQEKQVRFYETPADPARRWPARDLYSFYSHSGQGGLLLEDVNGDGLADILCGNYWIESPASFDLAWRLHAIHLWNQTTQSALLELHWTGSRLLAAQRALTPGRLAWFEKPRNPRAPWRERLLSADLDRPGVLQTADFDGDGREELLVGETGGAGRLILFRDSDLAERLRPGPKGAPAEPRVSRGTFSEEIGRVRGLRAAFAQDVNQDGRTDLIVVRANGVGWWENTGLVSGRAQQPATVSVLRAGIGGRSPLAAPRGVPSRLQER
ncbi:MAG: VCBS repeat-containing protein [Acidobacteria bacterium]|nr:VCBS repeat-containing protein [Acidobacteriota bacterium]